jgi:hypothetical protein
MCGGVLAGENNNPSPFDVLFWRPDGSRGPDDHASRLLAGGLERAGKAESSRARSDHHCPFLKGNATSNSKRPGIKDRRQGCAKGDSQFS